MTSRRQLVAANWKMNASVASTAAWLDAFAADVGEPACDIVVCPPYPYLLQVAAGVQARTADCGAQDLSAHKDGAFTGEVAGEMLLDVGARWVIVGHSERRQMHGETSRIVADKVARALEAGLRPIVCVGETLTEREDGRTFEVVAAQLAEVLDRVGAAGLAVGAVAYEPVWAIGTGRTASPAQAQEVHAALRAQVAAQDASTAAELRLLYGGSVKPANAVELFSQPDIDGGLIGGASLIAGDFLSICAAARN